MPESPNANPQGPQGTAEQERLHQAPVQPDHEPRAETGVIAFEDDWPGLFIRGDDALHFAASLQSLVNGANLPTSHAMLERLVHLLWSVQWRPDWVVKPLPAVQSLEAPSGGAAPAYYRLVKP